MSKKDFERMSRDQIVAWFASAPESELAEILRTAAPADNVPEPPPGGPIPLLLTSIRLPVELVRDLDEAAAAEGTSRSEAIRLAVANYVRDRRGGVGPAEAERALDVIRRVVGEHVSSHRQAA